MNVWTVLGLLLLAALCLLAFFGPPRRRRRWDSFKTHTGHTCIVGGTYQAKCVHQTVTTIRGGQKFPGCPSGDNESHPVEWILTGIPANDRPQETRRSNLE